MLDLKNDTFDSFGFAESVVKGVRSAGYEKPTPIQAAAIPIACAQQDLIGCAQTGTGKTAAFVLPLIDRLVKQKKPTPRFVRSLIISPTRELALQITKTIQVYGRYTQLLVHPIYGGVDIKKQTQALGEGVDIVVATPGRLLDHMNRGNIDLKHIEVLILDEADRMLDMGFIDDINTIISQISENRQTMLFSATMPLKVEQLAQNIMREPQIVQIGHRTNPAETVEQHVCAVKQADKMDLLIHVLYNEPIEKVIVFSRTKKRADRIDRRLRNQGFPSVVIHSDRSQNQRQQALEGFQKGRFLILVATNVASRGIDLEGVTHVINFDTPEQEENYIHRIGRTGRADARGHAITFVSEGEYQRLLDIEEHIGKQIDHLQYDGFVGKGVIGIGSIVRGVNWGAAKDKEVNGPVVKSKEGPRTTQAGLKASLMALNAHKTSRRRKPIQREMIEGQIDVLHRKYPAAIPLDSKIFDYPYYKVTLSIRTHNKKKFNAKHIYIEFFLKAISKGISDLDHIANLFGISSNDRLARNAIQELIRDGHIVLKETGYKITDSGVASLKKKQWSIQKITILIDGITGEVVPSFRINTVAHPIENISPFVLPIESVEDIPVNGLQNVLDETSGKNAELQLIKIESIENSQLTWHRLHLILFQPSPEKEHVRLEVFGQSSIEGRYKAVLKSLHNQGNSVLPIFLDQSYGQKLHREMLLPLTILNPHYETARRIEHAYHEAKAIHHQQDSAVNQEEEKIFRERARRLQRVASELKFVHKLEGLVHAYEIEKKLLSSIELADESILVVAPIDSFLTLETRLKSLLQNVSSKIQITFMVGVLDRKKSKQIRKMIKSLKSLKRRYKINLILKRNLRNKFYVVDKKIAVVSRFKKRKFIEYDDLDCYDEMGLVIRDSELVEDLYELGMSIEKDSFSQRWFFERWFF